MPARRSAADKTRFFKLLNDGMRKTEAARTIGIDRKTADAWIAGAKDSSGKSYRERQELARLSGPKHYSHLKGDAKRAFDDFEFFRRYHFGRLSSPWQLDAYEKFAVHLASDRKEFINLNCPPGGGKSTLLHDIECHLTVKNRAIRGMVGSSTQRNAVKYSTRLRRTFERPKPPQVDPAEVAAGRAVEPVQSLTQAYGRFQPDVNDVWRAEEFIVAQYGDIAIGEKEPTWQAYGLDTDYLGNRVDIAVWDDVVTKATMRTIDSIEKQREKWDDEAETRIEPGGALFLVGQRLGPLDLYAYNKAKLAGLEEDEDEESDWDDGEEYADEYFEIEAQGSTKARMYHSFVYPAHDDSRCKGKHSYKEPAYWAPDEPDNCLLDPRRLSWGELRQKQKKSMEKYDTVYQQKDVDAASVLVPRIYVTGGEFNGESFPGCYDVNRSYHELPKGLSGTALSVCTVDPSPSNWWSVQWWIYDQVTEFRHFMDMTRQKMGADQFLDFNPDTREYTGVLEDMWQTSDRLGRPFKNLIIEKNGAQRFLGQLSYFKSWCSLRGVSFFPHDTGAYNKSDADYGVQVLTTHYRHGRYRLPNKAARGDLGFIITRQLVDEVTVWPDGATDDCVMAQWFLEWWIPRLANLNLEDWPKKNVPRHLLAG